MGRRSVCQRHVTPVNFRGLESSGGQSWKWGKGQCLPAVGLCAKASRNKAAAGQLGQTGRAPPGCWPPRKAAHTYPRPGQAPPPGTQVPCSPPCFCPTGTSPGPSPGVLTGVFLVLLVQRARGEALAGRESGVWPPANVGPPHCGLKFPERQRQKEEVQMASFLAQACAGQAAARGLGSVSRGHLPKGK